MTRAAQPAFAIFLFPILLLVHARLLDPASGGPRGVTAICGALHFLYTLYLAPPARISYKQPALARRPLNLHGQAPER